METERTADTVNKGFRYSYKYPVKTLVPDAHYVDALDETKQMKEKNL